MLTPRQILIFLPFCLASLAMAQKDTSYVHAYPHKLTMSFRFIAKDYQVEFQSPESGKLNFQNAGINIGMRIQYKKLGIAFSVPVISFNRPDNGTPGHLGLSANVYQPAFYIRMGLRKFNGFTQLSGGPNIFREDMRMWHGNARGYYLFNHPRFSLRSSFRLSEWQIKSQGSWIGAGLLSSQILDADSLSVTLPGNGASKLRGYRSFKGGLGGGYAYTFSHQRWFFTLAATAGGEFRHIRYVLEDQIENRNQWRISPRINLQAGLGYNGKEFFAAITGFYLPGADFTDELNVRVADAQVNLVIGRRFRNRELEVLDSEQ